MDRNAFHGLLKKYLDGKCTEEEKVIIDKWYDLLDDTDVQASAGDDQELEDLEDRLWNKIHGDIRTVPDRPEKASRSQVLSITRAHRKYWYAAAMVIVIAGIGLLLMHKMPSRPQNEKPHQEIAGSTGSGQRQVIVLEDGSRITLAAGSKLDYPARFGKTKREVYLSGEAFFEVTKDPARPFFVYNNSLVTEVLGTSFNVRSVSNGIEVAVRTGKVAVYENSNKISLSDREKQENGVIITPNQKVTYYAEARHFVTSIVDAPLPVLPSPETTDSISFVYDDMPLSNVLASIEKAYDIEIVLENENIKSCPFTGDLTKPSLYNKLEFICQALGASYEIKGTKILLKGGKSCN